VQAIYKLGSDVDEARVKALVKAFDVNGTGNLKCWEFARMISDGGAVKHTVDSGPDPEATNRARANPTAVKARANPAAERTGGVQAGAAGGGGDGPGPIKTGASTPPMERHRPAPTSPHTASFARIAQQQARLQAEVAAKLQSQLGGAGGVGGVKAAATDADAKHVLEELQEALRQEALRMREAFRSFDDDGSGGITAAELQHGLRRLGVVIDVSAAEQLVRRFDTRSSGQLELGEFVKMVQSNPTRTFPPPGLIYG
jgi:Ca2+-binding EF-hand superfamily protein